MNARTVVTGCALLVACARAQPPAPAPSAKATATSAAAAPHTSTASATSSDVLNVHGLRGLLSAIDDVVAVELVRSDVQQPAEPLSAADRDTFVALVRSGTLTDLRVVAHAPWPAYFVLRTRTHGAYAVTLVGRANLRLHPGTRDGKFHGDAARWNGAPPEMVVPDDDGWLWSLLEARLGETEEKEYRAPAKAPDYLELPQRPAPP